MLSSTAQEVACLPLPACLQPAPRDLLQAAAASVPLAQAGRNEPQDCIAMEALVAALLKGYAYEQQHKPFVKHMHV
jgi:hypothetical protein